MLEFQSYMLELLYSAIHRQPPPSPPAGLDWHELYQEARAHMIDSVLFSLVEQLPAGSKPEDALLLEWKGVAFSRGLHQMRQEAALKALLDRIAAENLRVLVLKGITLSALYPEPHSRTTCDIDLLASEEQLLSVEAVLRELGYAHNPEASSDNVKSYSRDGVAIELHLRLWEENIGERYHLLSSLEIDGPERHQKATVRGVELWTLPPQSALFYLMYHMIKHFFVCGIGVRYLADITLFVEAHGHQLDWSEFWRQAELLGYTAFCRSLFLLCVRWLGMPDAPFEGAKPSMKEEQASNRLLEDILSGGHGGRKTLVRYKAGRVLRIYYENETKKMPKGKLAILRSLLFPKRAELENHRTEQVRFSGFLPFAWIQHLFYLLRRNYQSQQQCSIRDRVQCAQDRLALLGQLDLIDEVDTPSENP